MEDIDAARLEMCHAVGELFLVGGGVGEGAVSLSILFDFITLGSWRIEGFMELHEQWPCHIAVTLETRMFHRGCCDLHA